VIDVTACSYLHFVPVIDTHRQRILLALALCAGIAIAVGVPRYQQWALARQLEPHRFNSLTPTEVAKTLNAALGAGVLNFRSTAEIEAWLLERPQALRAPAADNPLLAFRAATALRPESQAWLLIAALHVVPTLPYLEHGATAASKPPVPERIRSIRNDYPKAAAVITTHLRAQPVFANPLAEFAMLAELNPGDIALIADAQRATPRPSGEIARVLLLSAIAARDEATRAAMVEAGTDMMLAAAAEGTASSTFGQWSNREAPVVALIRQHRLKHAEAEQCINFGHASLPPAPIDAVWTRRVAEGKDALCNWYRSSHAVPAKELLIAEPEATLRLVTGFTRPMDGWRREVLIESLASVLGRGLHDNPPSVEELRWCARHKNEPTVCLWLTRPDVTRAVRATVHGPNVKIGKTAGGTTLTFVDPAFARAWRSRLATRKVALGSKTDTRSNLAALAKELGVDESSVRVAFERELPYFICEAGSDPTEVWGRPSDCCRLARVRCNPQQQPLPHNLEAWPRSATDARAASWFKQRASALLLADSRGVRIVWLPQRPAIKLDEVVGVADLDGDGRLEMIFVYYITNRCSRNGICEPEDMDVEIMEVTPDDNFSYPVFTGRPGN
jgi:hypothetical protein